MKKILILIPVLLIAFACKNSVDKKAELETLKTQQNALNTKISALEKEIGLTDTTKKKEKLNFVTVDPVKINTFNHLIELQGSVVADEEVFITSKVPGSITQVNIRVGDKVQAGQVIAEIDDAIIKQQLDELQNRMDFATDIYNKQKTLWDQKIGSEVQFTTAKNNVDALQKSKATLLQSLDMYHIKAPISGIADEVAVKVGSATAPGAQLAKLVNFSRLKVKADVAEAFAGKVRQGTDCVVSFPDIKKDIPAKITYIGNSINPMNRTFKVEVNMKPNEQGLIPNMLSLIKVADYSASNAIAVPINLLQKDLEGDYVLISDDTGTRAKKARVKIGNLSGDKAEIKEGLKSGDKLIMTGYQDLNDGDAIKF